MPSLFPSFFLFDSNLVGESPLIIGLQVDISPLSISIFMADFSLKGTHWGRLNLNSSLQFMSLDAQSKPIFELNPSSVANATNATKDIILHLSEDKSQEGEGLTEIRFHCTDPEFTESKSAESGSHHAKTICEKVRQKFLKDKASLESLLTFSDIFMIVPRGKHTMDIFPTLVRCHGKTFSFSFHFADIVKCFLLPSEKQSQVNLALKLRSDRPVYHGQTAYDAIIMQIDGQDQSQIPSKVCQKSLEQFPQLKKLQPQYKGRTVEILTDVFKIVGNLTFVAPNAQEFQSKEKKTFVKCGIKAQPGTLYFFKKALLFIPKPVTYIKLDEIAKVSFVRVGLNIKQFDMVIKMPELKKGIEFHGLDNQNFEPISQFFVKRGVKIEQEKEVGIPAKDDHIDEQEDNESDDGDFEVADDMEEEDESMDEKGLEDELEGLKGAPKNKPTKKP